MPGFEKNCLPDWLETRNTSPTGTCATPDAAAPKVKARKSAVRRIMNLLRLVDAQPEREHDEDGHLLAGHGIGRAELPPAAAGHHAAPHQLLDPAAVRARRRDVGEHRRRARTAAGSR